MSIPETTVGATVAKVRPVKVILGIGVKEVKLADGTVTHVEDTSVVNVRKTFADKSTNDATMSVKHVHYTFIGGVKVMTSVDCIETVPVYDANGKVIRTTEYRQNGMCLPLESQKRKDTPDTTTTIVVNAATGEVM